MIPITLRLKNFLSYGPELQTIDFGAYHLICLSGKNGHGKSALLDAITWAVWGQARKTSGAAKADEHLLRLGQTFMSVSFDFICNGQTYRVKREYGKTYAKPYATVEFGILDAQETFHALTDKTIRGTQKKIEKTIGIDFETFTNTAFLRQGQSHEFSQKSPKERKNVLANILGLQRFEVLKKAALDKSKDSTQQQQFLEQTRQRLTHDMEHKSELERTRAEIETKLKKLEASDHVHQTQEAQLIKQRETIQTKLNKLDVITVKIQHTQTTESTVRTELTTLYHEWRDINQKQRLVQQYGDIESRIKRMRQTVSNHQQQLHKHLELKEKVLHDKEHVHKLHAQLEKHYATELETHVRTIHDIETARAVAQKNHETYTKDAQRLGHEITALTRDCKALEKKLAGAQQHTKRYAAVEHQFDKRKRYFHEWTAQANQYARELQQLTQKITVVTDFENPSCPLCEQNLSASRKKFLKSHCDKQAVTLRHKIDRFSRILTALKQLLLEQHKDITALKQQHDEYKQYETELHHKIEQLKTLQSQEQQLIKDQQTLAASLKELETRHKNATLEHTKLQKSIATRIAQTPEFTALATKLTQLETELATVVYDAQQHKKDTEALAQLEQNVEQLTTIKQELAQQPKRYDHIADKIAAIKNLKRTRTALLAEAESFKQDQAALEHLLKDHAALTHKRKELQAEREALLQRQGTLNAQYAALTKQEQELKTVGKHMAEIADTGLEYQVLGQALGKDGIQALLIEEALPEIEQEANNLLSQLTDNQAHIMIESLRDLKSGGTKETLDIKISDPMGVRPYEMYSGGEAFRIDFALRIAISKLLAHRAGTSLQTLIIDEGFGSQDEEGLARIMDCIYKIQDNFHKVIIVSHLSVMKDQFPVHFCVEKGANGSKITVVEQG